LLLDETLAFVALLDEVSQPLYVLVELGVLGKRLMRKRRSDPGRDEDERQASQEEEVRSTG